MRHGRTAIYLRGGRRQFLPVNKPRRILFTMHGLSNSCDDPCSILVILPTWVGDFVMATPALRAIRERFVGAHIVFLMEPNLREVARGGDWMNECVEWPAKTSRTPLHRAYRNLVWDLRRRRFDWAILFPNSFRAALVARLAGAKRRIGYDRDGRGFLLTNRIAVRNRRGGTTRRLKHDGEPVSRGDSPPPLVRGGSDIAGPGSLHPPLPKTVRNDLYWPMPMVAYYADLVELIGCKRPGDRLELFTTPDSEASLGDRMSRLDIGDQRPLIVISPGAKYGAAKCWLPERFAAVADRLIEEDGASVVITCGPGEESIADSIAREMRHPVQVFRDPLLTLGELKSLIRRSDLLICTDAGPRHFAKAFEISVVTVFGPTHPDWTATSYQAERIVRADLECGPCQRRVCPLKHHECMKEITVEIVLSASRELLRAHMGLAAP